PSSTNCARSLAATATSCPRSRRRSASAARSARCATRCGTSSASTGAAPSSRPPGLTGADPRLPAMREKNPVTHEEKLAYLRELRDEAIHAGTEEAVEKQHDKGKLTARERIEK